MPRIDPLQLLKCLSVLLTPEGGILSSYEVPRLVNLMTKFSKKLVSKCIYLLILKNTEVELVDMFMGEGGWALIQTWLQDAIQIANWELVREILELLLVTPADVQRLKMNVLPKLIKNLSRREELGEVADLSSKLVQQWLSIVKKTQAPQSEPIEPVIVKPAPADPGMVQVPIEETKQVKIEYVEEEKANGALYKTSDKDGKIVIRKLSNNVSEAKSEEVVEEKSEDKKQKERSRSSSSGSKDKHKDSDKDRKRSSSSSSKSRSSSSSSRSKDHDRKDRDRDKKYSSSHSSSRSSSSKSSSSRDKKESRSKDKERSKERHKTDKEKQEEKDQETLSKLKTHAIDKLGRIPKKSSSEDKSQSNQDAADIKKKFSVGIRKDNGKDERPKTVKVYNSKMRSTGLEEEVKPAPPRVSGKKPTPSVQLPTIPQKRPSPAREIREPVIQPEKKLKIDKIDIPDRPGAIKLIPAKPKPAFLQESDIFSDALTAACTKKEPKKRKRRPSVGKEAPTSPTSPTGGEQSQAPTSPSALGLKNIAPINFYQDTLAQEADEDDKENEEETKGDAKEEEKEGSSSPKTPTYDGKEDESAEPTEAKRAKVADGGLRGVLLYTKKRGPKKSISWKNDDDLVEIKYFELDETERVNVSRASFGDMAKMEMTSERETLQLSRKLGGEDMMEAQIAWRFPMEIEVPDSTVVPGSKSLEKDIQFAREKSVLQALYFDKRRIPDSAEEPVPENHQMVDPAIIPLEDPDSQDIDLRSTPWPEPKGPAPQPEAPPAQPMFPQPGPFQPPFGNMPGPPPSGYQSIPQRFPNPGGGPPMGGPPMGMGGPAFMPPNMMSNGPMMAAPPPDMLNMNPNMFPMPPDMGYPDFPQFPNQMPPNMNMFPPNNHNYRPMGPERGGRGGRGMYRPRGGDGGGGWVRMTSNNWKRGGRGGGSSKLCKNIQIHGYCRNRENCMFLHP